MSPSEKWSEPWLEVTDGRLENRHVFVSFGVIGTLETISLHPDATC